MQLKTCPDLPNCVSSQSVKPAHWVSPIAFQGQSDQVLLNLKQLMLAMPSTQLIEEKQVYLQVQFQTRWLKFVDDVEVFVDADMQLIHIRSASRVGYWDFGANRKRVEQIRVGFYKLNKYAL